MTDPRPPLLSVLLTPPRGQSAHPENNMPASSNHGDTIVRTSSRSHLDGDNHDDGDSLRPEPSGESDSGVENNKFAFSPGQLNKLISPKCVGALGAFGGLRGLEKGLRTDVRSGLSMDETMLDGARWALTGWLHKPSCHHNWPA